MSPTVSHLLRFALALTVLAPVERLDRGVQRAVQDWRRPALEAPMRAASSSGHGGMVFAGLLAVALVTGPAGPATARAAIGALAPVNLVVEGLKWSVNRTRPDGDRRRANSSFPSSHAANAAGLALVLGRRWRRLAPGLWLLAVLVGFSRIYLNRHFLSDVLCGVAIGVGIGWLAFRWLRARGWTWEPRG
ncbi:MAG: phosphatase PAP2 family protein [Candidatus Eisenbacteria bacterium]